MPTRHRLKQATRALDSIVATAERPERLEVIMYTDDDDVPSQALDRPGLTIIRLVRERATMGEITRRCFAASSGRYVMLLNDDVVFRTRGWDMQVLAAFGRFDDDVALVWGNDLCGGAPAHPFVSRTACRVMGEICPAAYHREFIDTHLHDIFRMLRRLGHDRLVHLPDVVFEHLHAITGKAEWDAGYAKTWRFNDERTYIAWNDERAHRAAALARHIDAARAFDCQPAAV